jgi:uncharacterized protein YcbK (DUF882 family)
MVHFTLSEFDSPDLPGSGQNMDSTFLNMLDSARELAGIPFKINSGMRTTQRNMEVGGKIRSSHLVGLAADIHVTDSRSRFIILNALISVGFNRIGIAKTFIHVDNDLSKAKNVYWTY